MRFVTNMWSTSGVQRTPDSRFCFTPGVIGPAPLTPVVGQDASTRENEAAAKVLSRLRGQSGFYDPAIDRWTGNYRRRQTYCAHDGNEGNRSVIGSLDVRAAFRETLRYRLVLGSEKTSRGGVGSPKRFAFIRFSLLFMHEHSSLAGVRPHFAATSWRRGSAAEPNQRAAGKGATGLFSRFVSSGRALPEHNRYACS